MAKWYIFDLSFFIPDSKRKTRNKFKKNEKAYEKFNKIFLKYSHPHLEKDIFTQAGDRNKQFFYFGLTVNFPFLMGKNPIF